MICVALVKSESCTTPNSMWIIPFLRYLSEGPSFLAEGYANNSANRCECTRALILSRRILNCKPNDGSLASVLAQDISCVLHCMRAGSIRAGRSWNEIRHLLMTAHYKRGKESAGSVLALNVYDYVTHKLSRH